MAKTVSVELTLTELGTLRRLIVEEYRRLGGPYQRPSDEPSKVKRLRKPAQKIWEAYQRIRNPVVEWGDDAQED